MENNPQIIRDNLLDSVRSSLNPPRTAPGPIPASPLTEGVGAGPDSAGARRPEVERTRRIPHQRLAWSRHPWQPAVSPGPARADSRPL